MRRSRVQGFTNFGSVSETVCYVASSNHAKFHAFVTKVNNSAIFWTITAVLLAFMKPEISATFFSDKMKFF